jgi:two-component system alkaline phosphatase synthesis response regulator PhoP
VIVSKIVIVDDEEQLLRGLTATFNLEGFSVVTHPTGEGAINLVLKENPDLILLDVMLPGTSGVDVCRELRRKGIDTPIIMLSARGEEIDRVLGLEIGADDYVTKPFSLRELVARVRVCLRRQPTRSPERISRYRMGDVEVDFESYRATRAGVSIDMTPKEIELLRLLVEHRGQVVTRDRILNEVWGIDAMPTTRTVDTHILRLRQKLEDDPANPRSILSVYGEGYRFVG